MKFYNRHKKRTAEEYDDEIEKTAKRMRKKREALRSASDSGTWLEFLDNLGIDVSSPARLDFFEKVRNAVRPPSIIPSVWKSYLTGGGYSVSAMQEARVVITSHERKGQRQIVFRDSSGKFTSGKRFR